MTEQTETRSNAQASRWEEPKTTPALAGPLVERWRDARNRLCALSERECWSKSETARRADVPVGTLLPWADGTYGGKTDNITERVERFLDAHEERIRISVVQAPGFIMTPTAREMTDTLIYAQTAAEMVVVTLGAGMGKTMTAREYAVRPHAHLVTMRPTTSNVHAMLQELAVSLSCTERNPVRLDRAVGERLKRNGREPLLIVDEAQNLSDNSVNQLRYFLDEYGCGIALVGNEELYGRFGGDTPKAAYAQLHRRIGKRLRRLMPLQADIDALVAAWQLDDPKAAEIARKIGKKPGALSQVSKTLTLAAMIASGEGKPLSAAHLRQAWSNRGGEDLYAAAAA